MSEEIGMTVTMAEEEPCVCCDIDGEATPSLGIALRTNIVRNQLRGLPCGGDGGASVWFGAWRGQRHVEGGVEQPGLVAHQARHGGIPTVVHHGIQGRVLPSGRLREG